MRNGREKGHKGWEKGEEGWEKGEEEREKGEKGWEKGKRTPLSPPPPYCIEAKIIFEGRSRNTLLQGLQARFTK